MAKWTEAQLQAWYQKHGPERGREDVYENRSVPVYDSLGNITGSRSERTYVGEKITAQDGATVELIRLPESGQPGRPDYEVTGNLEPDPTRGSTPRSPAQNRADEAVAAAQEAKNQQEIRDNNERSYNQSHPDEYGETLPETHIERAARIAKRKNDERQAAQTEQSIAASKASVAQAQERAKQDAAEAAQRTADNAADRALRERQIQEQETQGAYTRNKPEFLSRAEAENPYVVRYDPQTGAVVSEANPNYDAVKAAAEEKRKELAAQISQRRMSLDEAQASYTQWFDLNVKGPMYAAQEARAKAEEQRQALEAEERRRQFAADFSLRRGQLGESAAQRATNAEISLLPYRAGPTEAAEMSSAINSLAAGGKVYGPDASAGIHFTPEAFQFAAPDFAGIAKKAAASALEGISSYKPSQQQYQTADYSGVPGINLQGAPALPTPVPYTYQGAGEGS